MANNESIGKFRQLIETIKRDVHAVAAKTLKTQANKFSNAVAAKAPVHSGTLKSTVHVIPGNFDLRIKVSVGGQETIRPSVSSKPYDYARADEFGTVNMPASPFFFPTYNGMKADMKATMKDEIARTINGYSSE